MGGVLDLPVNELERAVLGSDVVVSCMEGENPTRYNFCCRLFIF